MNLTVLNAIYEGYKSRDILSTVSPNDEMWVSSPEWYFSIGESGLDCVLNGLSGSWLSSVGRILDMPCGYGRVARHLRAAFPDAELVVSDLDRGGVDFCAEQFRGTGVYSQPDLTAVSLPGQFDLIWVGSLFTHVDAERTARWMEKLVSHLSPHGVVVATFHGLWSIEEQSNFPLINSASWTKIYEQFKREDYGYSAYTEYDLGDYGVSLSHPRWVMKMATEIPGTRVVSYRERGWANNHDVLTIARNDRLARHG